MENGFLKEKYGLHKSPEVEQAAKRTEVRTGEKVPQNPETRIQNYLDRLQNIINPKELGGHPNFDRCERNLEMLKHSLYDKFVIKPEEIPEGYFENQRRLAREQGHGDIEITRDMRDRFAEVIVSDQRSTLDNWVDYLASPDATYPDWLKYYAIRSVLSMGEFDKDKKQFTKRSKGTTKPFPDLNREALAYVLDAIEKKYKGEKPGLVVIEAEDKDKFEKLLQGENFAKLYTWAIEKVTPASKEALADTRGKWVKYLKRQDHMPLVKSLQGHGTNWCTAGESTAKAQLENGDFYVYYSLDKDGKPTIPRAAIRMKEDRIAEIRGVADKEQNMDPYITPVVEAKLKEFPDGKVYEKKTLDMKTLTVIEQKTKTGEKLTKADLLFLYEINTFIEGFGFHPDPRIAELRAQRNIKEDMPVVFECTPEQITYTPDGINENTKAYVGKLEPGIFQKLPENLEHIYTSFPKNKIRKENIEIGGKTAEQLLNELEQAGIITDFAKDMFRSRDFVASKNIESATLIRLTVADLGFTTDVNNNKIYQRAEELGLELCPSDVGPHYYLKHQNQPRNKINEWVEIGMKQINAHGEQCVFLLARSFDGMWRDGVVSRSDDWRSSPNHRIVFRFRRSTPSINSGHANS